MRHVTVHSVDSIPIAFHLLVGRVARQRRAVDGSPVLCAAGAAAGGDRNGHPVWGVDAARHPAALLLPEGRRELRRRRGREAAASNYSLPAREGDSPL